MHPSNPIQDFCVSLLLFFATAVAGPGNAWASTVLSDDFTRSENPGPLSPWETNSGAWAVMGGVLQGGPNTNLSYGFAHVATNWTDCSVEGRIQFPAGAFGGGLGGRLDPTTGAHYAAWVYPEGSPGGSSVLRLVKFQTWANWGYRGSNSVPMQEVSLPEVGTNWHTLKVTFRGSQITVHYDNNQVASVIDAEEVPYLTGGISVGMWTGENPYVMGIDDVEVTASGADQTIAFEPPPNKTYGDTPFALSATASSGLPVSFSVVSGPATIAGTTVSLTGAGAVTVRASQAGNDSYNLAPAVDQSFTVNPATLTVTAANQSRPYGAANLPLTATITGFVNGDNPAWEVRGEPLLTTTASPTSNAGLYPITVERGDLSATNYTFEFVNGQLTVAPATLTVTAADTSRRYGQPNPPFSASLSGFVNGDGPEVVSGSPELSTTAGASSPAGAYPITPALGTLSATNYTFDFVNGQLTITPATLTVTADDTRRIYGQPNPTLTARLSGFVNGDAPEVVSGSPDLSTPAVANSPTGTYPITAALGTLSAVNYTFDFVNGQLSVTPATLTVTADDTWRPYGQPNPALTARLSGFVNGDPPDVVSGSPDLSTTAVSNSPEGTYPVTAAVGTLSAGNYTFDFVAGTLRVTPVSTLFYDNFSRPVDPGSLSPWEVGSGTWTITGGTLEGTTTTAQTYGKIYITNEWANYSVEARVRFPNAAYGGGLGGRLDLLTGAHYAAWIYPESSTGGSNVMRLVKFQSWTNFGYLNAASAPIREVILPGVGTDWHTLKLTFQDNQITAYYDGSQVMSVTDEEAEPYSAGAVSLDLWTDSTADLMQIDNVLVAAIRADQTINFDSLAAKTYGDAPFTLSATASSGLPVNFSIVSGPATLAGNTLILAGAGTVTVRASQSGDAGYNAAPDVDQSFTVKSAPLTVTADAKTKVYGEADPALTYQITSGSLIGGGSLGGILSGSLVRETGENVGTYAIDRGTLTAGSNYELTFLPANLTITLAHSTLALVSSLNPSPQGASVTFTATVSPVAPASFTPAGSVQFYANDTALGSPVILSDGVASLSTADLAVGTNTIVATCLGDGNFLGSTNHLTQVVGLNAGIPSTLGIQLNSNGTVTITFAGTPGAQYLVQAGADLAGQVWGNVSTNVAGADGRWTFTDSATSLAQRYYRSAKP